MKLMQKGYNEIQGLEIELRILEQTSAPPSRPRKYFCCMSELKEIHFHVKFQLFLPELIENIFCIKNKTKKKTKPNHTFTLTKPARDGYFIFCYGDCNRKYEEALAARSANTGDSLMKKFWLELYNRQYKY